MKSPIDHHIFLPLFMDAKAAVKEVAIEYLTAEQVPPPGMAEYLQL